MKTLKISIIFLNCYFCISACLPLEVPDNNSGSQSGDSEDLLSRVTRKSVFIAPRLFHAQGIINCPQGFTRTVSNNCVEIIEPSPKAFENVLLERLKSIDYEYEEELIATTSFVDETTSKITTSETYFDVKHPRQKIQNRVSGSLSEYLSEVTDDSARITATTEASSTSTSEDWSSGSTTYANWLTGSTKLNGDLNDSKTTTADVTSTTTTSNADTTTNIATTNSIADSNINPPTTNSMISNSENDSSTISITSTTSSTITTTTEYSSL